MAERTLILSQYLLKVLHQKLHFARRKSDTEFLCVKTVSDRVLTHSLAYLSMQNWLVGTSPSTWKFDWYWPTHLQSADFQSIFVRSASTVTSGEEGSINTNRKFTTRFPLSLKWTSYVAPKPPKGGWKTQNGRLTCKIALASRKSAIKWGDDGKSKCVVTCANSLTSVRRLAVAKRQCS